MSNIKVDEGSFSSGNIEEIQQLPEKQKHHFQGSSSGLSGATKSNSSTSQQRQQPIKKKRSHPGTPDPNAEVTALSPTTLMATNRFVCEICNKGFQRDQNLQLHRRGHNLPWKLRQRTSSEVKKRVYVCPEPTCVHHNPSRALGDLTGIKKHFRRKHGEKKWKCDKCSKKYAVQSDWKAHQKTCGTREYKCDCGTIFSRKDSFITHRAFCDALAEENNKVNQGLMINMGSSMQNQLPELTPSMPLNTNTNTSVGMSNFNNFDPKNPLNSLPLEPELTPFKSMNIAGDSMFSSSTGALFGGPRGKSSAFSLQLSSNCSSSGFTYLQDSENGSHAQISGSPHMSATALLLKAVQMGATASNSINSPLMQRCFATSMAGPDQLSSIRPPSSYEAIQQHNNAPYDQFPSQPDHHNQTNMVTINGGGFINHPPMQKGQKVIPRIFDAAGTGSYAVNEMGMFASMFAGTDQNHGFVRGMEHEDNGTTTTSLLHGTMSKLGTGTSESGDMHTHDFMGIGGQRYANLHEHLQYHHQQQQSRLARMEAMGQQKRPMMNNLQQHLSLGETGIEKPWDV